MSSTRWKALLTGAMALVLALAVAACGGDDDEEAATTPEGDTEGTEQVSTAIVLPCPLSDAWCKQGHDAAQTLADEGEIDLEVTTNAPQDTAGVTRVLNEHAQAGNELILAHSTWEDAAVETGNRFPEVNIATYGVDTTENVAILEEPIYEPAYLAGMIAGGITESNVIGGSAGQDVPLCRAELEAFHEGAQRVNEDVEFIDGYMGEWNDAALGKRTTESQIGQGADVVLACGGGPATGMIEAIKEHDVSGFGYVGDQSDQAPEHLVGSVMYHLEPYFRAAVDDVRNGEFQPAEHYEFGLAEDGVSLDLNDRYNQQEIPDEVIEEMEQVREEIRNGEFEVPFVPEG